jgi:hypothetical protein
MKKIMRPLSYRQIQAIELWLGSGRKSKAEALREAGYGESIARQPHKVFGSPAVLKELEKRGYDARGVRLPPQMLDLTKIEIPTPANAPAIDFSKLPLETLQELKVKLGMETAPVTMEPSRAYVPRGSGVDIFNAGDDRARGDDLLSFSSM